VANEKSGLAVEIGEQKSRKNKQCGEKKKQMHLFHMKKTEKDLAPPFPSFYSVFCMNADGCFKMKPILYV